MRKITAVILIMILTLSLAACGKEGGDSLAYALYSSPSTLDPQYSQGNSAQIIIGNCFEGLTRIDENGNIAPGVATDWEISPDGLTYTFNLREDSGWYIIRRVNASTLDEKESRYEPVTAYDFSFAFFRAVKQETDCPDYSQFAIIKNAEKVHNENLSAINLGVNALDSKTLEINLERPCPEFLYRLSTPAFMPCNEEFFNACDGRYGLNASYLLCNGPFAVTAWDSSSSLIMRKNAGYSGENEAKPSSVSFYFNNDINDISEKVSLGTYCAGVFTDEENMPSQGVNSTALDNSVYGFCFNCSDSYFSNENLRLALMCCVDRGIFTPPEGSTQTNSCVPLCCRAGEANYIEAIGSQTVLPASDTTFAMISFQKALSELNAKSLKLNILCEEKYSGYIRSQIQIWQKVFDVNLSVSVETLSENAIETRMRKHDYQFAFAPVHSYSGLAANYLSGFMSGDGDNIFAFEDEYYDNAVRTTFNIENPRELLNGCFTMDSYLTRHAVFYPLFTGRTYLVEHRSVSGVKCSPSGDCIYFSGAISSD
ncbi:MAG: peptide ABC transporter substrate-binding protein [Clostridia bacterium]|nr:peptide ABC transporter substrate-binding protein [Clostridia bacterium]